MRFPQALPCPPATPARKTRTGDEASLSAADKLTVVVFALGALAIVALVLRIRSMHSEKLLGARQMTELRVLSEEAMALLSKERSDGSWRSRRIAGLLDSLRQADCAIATLGSDLTKWQRKHYELANEALRATDEWSARSADLARIVNDESTLRHREKAQSEAQLAEAEARLQKEEAELREAQRVLEGAALENRSLGAEIIRLRGCISSLQSEVSRLRCERDSALAAEASCESGKSSLCSEISSLRSEIASLRSDCARRR